MEIEVLQQQLNPDVECPLCHKAMYDMESMIYGRVYYYFQCSSAQCKHQIFPQKDRICYCNVCRQQHKQELANCIKEEKNKNQPIKETRLTDLYQLSLLQQLFLLSVLEHHLTDDLTHSEYIPWSKLKYRMITPNYYYQHQMIKQFLKQGYLVETVHKEPETYYVNLSLDGYNEPSLSHLYSVLKRLFYDNLVHEVPFYHADEVKNTLYTVLYQHIVQYCTMVCHHWGIRIAGNHHLEQVCFMMMERLALSQIFYLVSRALYYLYEQNLLKPLNKNFVNTNILKQTLLSYYEISHTEKWESYSLPYPERMPLSTLSQIFLIRFLKLPQDYYYKPIWKIWQELEPRLNFYAKRRCIHCGSQDVIVEHEEENKSVTLYCQNCEQQDYYFIGSS